ncbi:hypothetical protein ACOME3_004960 [Neoechinorhynchus agilis]
MGSILEPVPMYTAAAAGCGHNSCPHYVPQPSTCCHTDCFHNLEAFEKTQLPPTGQCQCSTTCSRCKKPLPSANQQTAEVIYLFVPPVQQSVQLPPRQYSVEPSQQPTQKPPLIQHSNQQKNEPKRRAPVVINLQGYHDWVNGNR